MALVKIFFPKKLYTLKVFTSLYGHIVKKYDCYIFYVLDTNDNQTLTLIGNITDKDDAMENNAILHFIYAKETTNILIKCINIASFENNIKVHLILYDYKGFECLSKNCETKNVECDETDSNEIVYLAKLIKIKNENNVKKAPNVLFDQTRLKFVKFISFISSQFSFLFKPFERIFKDTSISYHFIEWLSCLKRYDFASGKAWTIVFDVLAGMIILIWLLYLTNPGEYLMNFTKLIVANLRSLLDALKGSPVGLKLNVQLNNFFLDCFKYHVDLWATFLIIVSPAINYLFIPLAIFGFFGLSFQLAMLSDLLILISLHAHCFYIYAAILYHIEIVGMKALWRVVLGRRKNVLKGRVESYDYMNRQLYLATMFFAGLLFLLPTVLVYYVVFASLRFLVYCITYCLMVIRRKILIFPIHIFLRWILGSYVSADSVELKIAKYEKTQIGSCNYPILTLLIRPKSKAPWKSIAWEIPENNSEKLLSIGKFLAGIISGDMMGFIQPKSKL